MADVKLYGADWCPLTTRARAHLEKIGVQYEYIDVEQDEAASKWVKDQNNGKEKKPTIDVDGQILSEPTNAELDQALSAKGLLA